MTTKVDLRLALGKVGETADPDETGRLANALAEDAIDLIAELGDAQPATAESMEEIAEIMEIVYGAYEQAANRYGKPTEDRIVLDAVAGYWKARADAANLEAQVAREVAERQTPVVGEEAGARHATVLDKVSPDVGVERIQSSSSLSRPVEARPAEHGVEQAGPGRDLVRLPTSERPPGHERNLASVIRAGRRSRQPGPADAVSDVDSATSPAKEYNRGVEKPAPPPSTSRATSAKNDPVSPRVPTIPPSGGP